MGVSFTQTSLLLFWSWDFSFAKGIAFWNSRRSLCQFWEVILIGEVRKSDGFARRRHRSTIPLLSNMSFCVVHNNVPSVATST